ncbi:MAG: hypothetical protein ACLTLQ_05370 [[Clostridium] scindens]
MGMRGGDALVFGGRFVQAIHSIEALPVNAAEAVLPHQFINLLFAAA